MAQNIQDIALQFKYERSNVCLGDIYNYIKKKFYYFIFKRCKTQRHFDESDVNTIITDTCVKIHKNIAKWDENICEWSISRL